MKTLIAFSAAALAAFSFANVARADEPRSLTVQFADLDLSKPQGAQTLFNRIKGAAARVCSEHKGGATLRDKQAYAACVDVAMSDAIARVDAPALNEYVANRNKKPAQVASR